MSITTPPVDIARDRWGRPMVTPPGGGKPVAYTRCTTFVDVLEDKYNLQKWQQRMVAVGLADRQDLLLAASAHRDDKRRLDEVCEQAREAAAASAAATTGTALHGLTEMIDRGSKLPQLSADVLATLDAYIEATKDLKARHIEQFCVQDPLKIGGTPDRIVKYGKDIFIADIKTGSIEWGTLKIAMQLAVYARSHTYDIATGERGTHGADFKRGIIIHLPADSGTCTLHWVDIEAGWYAVQVAKDVRTKRRLKFSDLTEPFIAPVIETGPDIPALIAACTTADQVRQVWAAHERIWTDAYTEAAKAHIATLPAAS